MAMMDNVSAEWIKKRLMTAEENKETSPISETIYATALQAIMADKRVSFGIIGDYLAVARGRVAEAIKEMNCEDDQRDSTGFTA